MVEQGTRLQVSVLDARGSLAVVSEGAEYRGRLVDSVSALEYGQRIRIQIGLDPGPDQSLSFDPVMTLMGTVSRLDEDLPAEPTLALLPGVEFAVEVLRLNRGLLWSATTGETEPGEDDGPSFHSKSGVEVCVIGNTGQLELLGASQVFTGWLVRVPLEFFLGQKLHLRVVVPTGEGGVENMDVLGRVVQILDGESRPGYAPFQPGVRFGFGIVQHSEGELPLPVVGRRWVDEFLIDSARVPAEVFLPPAQAGDRRVMLADPSPTDPGSPPAAMPQGDTTGIIGSLRQLSLISLLQSLELNRRTACVEISSRAPHASGRVYVSEGKMAAAFAGEVSGEEAFYALALLDRGAFRVRFEQEPPRRNIRANTTELILEVLTRSEEAEDAQRSHSGAVSAPFTDPEGPLIEDTFTGAAGASAAAGEAAAAARRGAEAGDGGTGGEENGFASELLTEEHAPPERMDEAMEVVATLTEHEPVSEDAQGELSTELLEVQQLVEPVRAPQPPTARDTAERDPGSPATSSPEPSDDQAATVEHDTYVGSVALPELPVSDEGGAVFSEHTDPQGQGEHDTLPPDDLEDLDQLDDPDDTVVGPFSPPPALDGGPPKQESTSSVFSRFFEELEDQKRGR